MSNGPVMTFGLGEALLALPVTLVQEILDPRPAAPLPDAPFHLLGVIDVRGTSVPVVDLRRLLGEEDRPDAPDTRLVVLLLDQAGQPIPVALRVDRVIEVTTLDDEPSPLPAAGLLAWDPRMLLGLGRRNGAFVALLNLEGLFAHAPLTASRNRAATQGASA